MRERRPGVWEVRVVVANDEVTGRSVQRSFTVHGDATLADTRRGELVERFGVRPKGWEQAARACERLLSELAGRFFA